ACAARVTVVGSVCVSLCPLLYSSLLECLFASQTIQPTQQPMKTLTEPDLFKEAIQYVLPKSLLEPLYHCFYYFEAVNMLMRKSKGEDLDAYEAAEGCMVRLKMNLEKQCTGLLPSRKEDLGVLVQKPSYKTSMKIISSVQSKIEGWEGPDLLQCSTEFLMEGSVVITREGNRRVRHILHPCFASTTVL
ncbi:Son of sevenless homolog 1, partial [Geodia barretti]